MVAFTPRSRPKGAGAKVAESGWGLGLGARAGARAGALGWPVSSFKWLAKFESSRRDLHIALLRTALQSQFFSKTLRNFFC